MGMQGVVFCRKSMLWYRQGCKWSTTDNSNLPWIYSRLIGLHCPFFPSFFLDCLLLKSAPPGLGEVHATTCSHWRCHIWGAGPDVVISVNLMDLHYEMINGWVKGNLPWMMNGYASQVGANSVYDEFGKSYRGCLETRCFSPAGTHNFQAMHISTEEQWHDPLPSTRPWVVGLTGLSTGCCGAFRWWCGVPFYHGCNFRHAALAVLWFGGHMNCWDDVTG